jgi:drug/metabolite transporter (DMT)-like permease
MTVRQLSIAATVLGVVAVILFVLGRSTLGVVFILLSGLAWTLTQYGRRRSGRDDDKPYK